MLSRNLFRRPRNKLESQGAEKLQRPEIPDEMYISCPACRKMCAADEAEANAMVCPNCGHHMRMSARRRIALVSDEGTFEEMWASVKGGDPLAFKDYARKIEAAREKTGENEGVITGICRIGGIETAIFAMEPDFIMGSMGRAVGEKITRLFEYAQEKGLSVVGFCVSGGARMQEGIISLMQMAKTSGAVKRHSVAGLLYAAVLTDPTTGGVMASFAMEGDITIAEPGALIGFAGPRVIEQTIRQKLKPGFQRSEFLLEKGFVDIICDRRALKKQLHDILALHERGPQI